MTDHTGGQGSRTSRALDILCKWRVLLTGWQVGTRDKTDPEAAAIRDHREVTLLLRAELSALVGVLVQVGVLDQTQWSRALEKEANLLSEDLSRRFPGVTADEHGLTIRPETAEWMSTWKP
jgi:predicted DNA-binding ArsR family transcriptional regulator